MMEQEQIHKEVELYVQILHTIKNAVTEDDLDSYKVSCALVNYVITTVNSEIASKYQQNAYENLGSVNLICLASKSAAVKVLQHLLSNKNDVRSLPFLTSKSNLLPEEEDDECHNAIYYAIRSNKVEIPRLLEKWINDFYKRNSEKIDDLLSKAFKELMIRNVYISEDMKTSIKSKLVKLRFFNELSSQKKNTRGVNDTENLKSLTLFRIDFVVENIKNLREKFEKLEPNEEFLLFAKCIAKNIFALKSSITCTCKLPWEEIEFCLVIFIRSCQDHFRKNPMYHIVLNKKRLLMHLETFSQILIKVKERIKLVSKTKKGNLLIDEIKGIETW